MAPLACVSTKRNSSENECTEPDNEKSVEISQKNRKELARDKESARSELTEALIAAGYKWASYTSQNTSSLRTQSARSRIRHESFGEDRTQAAG